MPIRKFEAAGSRGFDHIRSGLNNSFNVSRNGTADPKRNSPTRRNRIEYANCRVVEFKKMPMTRVIGKTLLRRLAGYSIQSKRMGEQLLISTVA
jgi:hypothetical protein